MKKKRIAYYNKEKDRIFDYVCCLKVYEAAKAMEKEGKIEIYKTDWKH